MLSPVKPLDGIEPIYYVSYSHEWAVQQHNFYLPWGPGEGPKGQISLSQFHEVNFKDFYAKLCECSHK